MRSDQYDSLVCHKLRSKGFNAMHNSHSAFVGNELLKSQAPPTAQHKVIYIQEEVNVQYKSASDTIMQVKCRNIDYFSLL